MGNDWYRKNRNKLIEEFGGECQNCGEENRSKLEFAHIKPTKVSGYGRGSNRRILDVMKNKDKYRLMCNLCHDAFDYDHPEVLAERNKLLIAKNNAREQK